MALGEPSHRVVRFFSQQDIGLKRLASLGAILVGTLVMTNWPLYHYEILNGPIPLAYYAIAPGFAVVLSVLHPRILLRALREPLVIWFVLYLTAGLLRLLIASDFSEVETGQWRKGLGQFVFFSAILMLASKADRTLLAKAILACALFASINNWLDFLLPFSYVPLEFSSPGRGAGLFINANQAGGAIIAMVVVALPFLGRRYRGLALLVMLFGVYPSFSRAAFLLGVIVATIAILLGQINGRQLALMGLLAPLMFAIGFSLYRVGISSAEIDLVNIEGRLDFFRTGGEIVDDSAAERRYVALLAWRMISESPIVGNGIGSTLVQGHGRGTHNMYLMLAAEQGVVGLLLYLTFVGLILRKGWRLFKRGITQRAQDIGGALVCIGTYFAFMGLFSHNLLEEPLALFLLAFLLAAANGAYRKFSTSHAVYSKLRGA
jgi:O-antigen ligase